MRILILNLFKKSAKTKTHMRLHQSGCVAILWLSRDTSRFNLQLECINKVLQKNPKKTNTTKKRKKKL